VIFIDTGAWVAKFVERDQYHQSALAHWDYLEKHPRPCFTSNFVLDETLTLLARRTTYAFAAERGKHLYESKWLQVLRPDRPVELRALDFFRKFADQSVSFTDCISFALMETNNIRSVFTFDRHFSLASFDAELTCNSD
jgi:predicted nucleic acid-binding protein